MRALGAFLALALALAVACGSEQPPSPAPAGGSLTDPRAVPTATPWPEPPSPIFLGATPLPASPTPVAAATGTYTVRAGDTLSAIAARLGVDLIDLMRLNNITDPNRIRVGQVLVVPGSPAR